MLRTLHFVLFLTAFALLTFAAAEDDRANVQSEIEEPLNPKTNDLETDATSWGYGRPGRYYGGGWGYGRGYGYGYPWRGYSGWGGRGWGGRGWGGWGGWGY